MNAIVKCKCMLTISFLTVAASLASANGYVPTDGLLGYWPMDTGWNDASGRGHNGIAYNSPEIVTDSAYGAGAGSFNKHDQDYIRIPFHSDFTYTNEITVSGWIKTTERAINSRVYMLGQVGGPNSGPFPFSVMYYGDGILWNGYNTQNQNQRLGSSSVRDGKWHHIVGRYDGSTLELWLDGALDASTSASGNLKYRTHDLHIAKLTDSTGWYSGLFDEIALWDRALTDEEIQILYRGGEEQVPEPSTMLAGLAGLAGVGRYLRQRATR